VFGLDVADMTPAAFKRSAPWTLRGRRAAHAARTERAPPHPGVADRSLPTGSPRTSRRGRRGPLPRRHPL